MRWHIVDIVNSTRDNTEREKPKRLKVVVLFGFQLRNWIFRGKVGGNIVREFIYLYNPYFKKCCKTKTLARAKFWNEFDFEFNTFFLQVEAKVLSRDVYVQHFSNWGNKDTGWKWVFLYKNWEILRIHRCRYSTF